MTDRSRRILVVVLLVAAAVLLSYAAIVLALVLRGDYVAGPLRLLTLVADVAAGVMALGAAMYFWRAKPPGG
jgi:hypothetical protein